MNTRLRILTVCLIALCLTTTGLASPVYRPTPESMEAQERMAKTSRDWSSCVWGWACAYPELDAKTLEKNKRRCLKQAVSLAKSTDDWVRCMAEWRGAFNSERGEYLPLLQNAESFAKTTKEWILCARQRLDLDQRDKVHDLLAKAEAASKMTDDWVLCINLRIDFDSRDRGQRDKGIALLPKAEAAARTVNDWTACAWQGYAVHVALYKWGRNVCQDGQRFSTLCVDVERLPKGYRVCETMYSACRGAG